MSISTRLTELMEERGISQSALARQVGVTQQTIGKLARGEAQNSVHLHKIARVLGTTVDYLTGETDDRSPLRTDAGKVVQQGFSSGEDRDIVEVAEIDARFGAGGVIMDEHAVPEMRSFSRSWLRQITSTPAEDLYWARTRGDSMAPTIGDGEPVLIDRRQDSVQDADLIWAFAWGDVGAIKRLRPMPDGTVKVLSDNPAVPPDVAHDDEIHIFGRVIAVVKKL